MTSENTAHGIDDPWRLLNKDRKRPATTPGQSAGVGTPGSTHPLDADLLPQQEYFLRHPQATGDLLIQGTSESQTAIDLLLAVIQKLPDLQEHLAHRGMHIVNATDAPQGFYLKGTQNMLIFPQAHHVAEGLSRLVTHLRQYPKHAILKKAGIIPLLK